MQSLPPIEQFIPVFHGSLEMGLNQATKLATISMVALPVIGGFLSAPLLIATRFGNHKEAEKSPLVAYVFTPLAGTGAVLCMAGLVAIGTVAMTVIVDLSHQLVMGRPVLCYRYVFFPLKLNFLNDILVHLNNLLAWRPA